MERAPKGGDAEDGQDAARDNEHDFDRSWIMDETAEYIQQQCDEMIDRANGPTGKPSAEDQPGSSAEHGDEPDNNPDIHPDDTGQH